VAPVSVVDRLSGLSEDSAEQCQRVRYDGVGTVIGEECAASSMMWPVEVVRLATVDVEHARWTPASAPPMSETVGTVSRRCLPSTSRP
jgi:hypothetical protein